MFMAMGPHLADCHQPSMGTTPQLASPRGVVLGVSLNESGLVNSWSGQ